jgi:N-acetylglucosaminyl-diphospho-decaprenol L-rhamnosyltransferase
MSGYDVIDLASTKPCGLAGTSAAEGTFRALDIVVVIVTYKSALLTIESLRSVQAERSSPGLQVRAVVVDNASGDLSAIEQAVQANGWRSWVTLVLAPKNGGFAYGNNLGIDHAYASGAPDYVYLLNPDAQVRAGAISALVRFLETHPEAGIAGSTFENLDGSEWPIAFRFPDALSTMIDGLEIGLVARLLRRWQVAQRMTKTAQSVDWVCGASMLIRPAVLAAIGGLDENYFLYFEETDFCFRARRAAFATWYVPESRVMHIRGQSTTVTDETRGPQRLPVYWFESRRRYFVVTSGMSHAMVIDIVALVAHSLGWLKRLVLRRMHTGVPYFIRDLARHSVLWPRNRHFPPVRHFSPPS